MRPKNAFMRPLRFGLAPVFLLFAAAHARAFAPDSLTVDVVPDLATLHLIDLDASGTPSPGEPFVIEGDMFEPGTTTRMGTFICRGWFIRAQADGDAGYVSQVFEFDGRGSIFVQGTEPGGIPGVAGFARAITGATGEFPAFGTALIEPMPADDNPLIFRATFVFATQPVFPGHPALTVDVIPDLTSLHFIDSDSSGSPTAGEAFVIEGGIFNEGATERIGTFICRGWFIRAQADGDVAYVSQVFEIDERGAIFLQGTEPGGVPGLNGLVRAITGAVGEFPGFGQALIEPMPATDNPLIFRATFRFESGPLTGVPGRALGAIPTTFSLLQNFPNPFNPSTTIRYELPKSGRVTLKIFNALGQEVRTLFNGELPAGKYSLQWDGRDNFGNMSASGTYLYRIEAPDFVRSRKMTLVK